MRRAVRSVRHVSAATATVNAAALLAIVSVAACVLAATSGCSSAAATPDRSSMPSTSASVQRPLVPMPLISRGAPAYTSGNASAAQASDADYGRLFRAAVPVWVAYDLSQVPAAHRGPVIVAWFNDPMTYPYDHKLVNDVGYNNLGSYTIDANPAAGGGRPPAAGWVTLAAVSGNTKRSRQHRVDLTGYNWLRINVTVSDGSPQNADAAFKLDVHDAGQGALDDWLFLGDSITANTMHHGTAGGGSVGNLSQLISAAQPAFYPLVEDGGIGGVTSAAGAAHIGEWLGLFGGRYVVLSYGTNNAGGGCDAGNLAAFERDYATMVTAVIAASKVPVIPTIPWANTGSIRSCGPRYNALIKALYARYPQIVAGPDLWAFFEENPGLISSDNLHPSDAGNGAYRKLWADALLKAVYP